LTEADVDRVTQGADADGWTTHEQALLRAVEELHASASISDDVWAVLAGQYDERQLVELPVLAGMFHMASYVFNALQVDESNPEWGGLDAR